MFLTELKFKNAPIFIYETEQTHSLQITYLMTFGAEWCDFSTDR